MKQRIYLSGGFFKRMASVPWQFYVTEKLESYDVEVFNPLQYYHPWKEDDTWYGRDIHNLHLSNIVFAYMDKDNPTDYGLIFEIGYARAIGAYVIFVNEKEGRDMVMVEKASNFLTNKFEEGLEHLIGLLTAKQSSI